MTAVAEAVAPDIAGEVAAASFREMALKDIHPSPLNPRKHFDQVKLEELAATMGNGVGVIEPLVVRPHDILHQITRNPGKAARNEMPPYELVAGERRWRAAAIAGLVTVPVIVKSLTDAQVLEIMVIENDQREDINPLEEGDGFKRLMTFGFDVDKLATRIGRSRKYIYDRVKLLDLIPPARELLLEDRITAGHAILIARLTPDQQTRVLKLEKRHGYGELEGPLFEREERLWSPDEPAPSARRKDDPFAGLKVRSVRELEAYIDQHCRFEPASAVNVELFPQTAATIEEAEKVISITYNHHVHPDAKDGNSQRIYSTVSWKRADGAKKSKTCDHSVTGVIVVGPNRGEAFKVCVNKDKCNTHWGAERRAKEKAAKKPAPANDDWKARQQAQEERWKREREAREREEKAWKAALPEILKAVAAKVRSQLPIAKVISELLDSQRSQDVKEAASLLGIAPTTGPEEALRTLLLVALLDESQFYQKTAFSKTVKTMLGVDVAAILKAHTSAAEAKPPAKPAKKKRAKKR